MTIITPHHRKSERLNVRIFPESKRLIQQAAALEHITLTDFILKAILEKAERTMTEQCCCALNEAELEELCKAFEHPAHDICALRKFVCEGAVVKKIL